MGEKLYYACGWKNNVEEARDLLNRGADVNWKDSDGWSPLHNACYWNRPDIVEVLLKHGPLITQETSDGNTPLAIACSWGCLDCVKLLLATGQCDLGIVNNEGKTALEEAITKNKMKVVKYLITTQPMGLSSPKIVREVMELALTEDDMGFIKYLFTKRSLNIEGSELANILKFAVRKGDVKFLKYLVTKRHLDINDPNIMRSILELSVSKGDMDFVKHLVTEKCFNFEGPDLVKSMLELAIREGDVDFIHYLVKEKCVDINGPDLVRSMVELAVRKGDVDFIKYLVKERDINGPDLVRSILKLAVRKGDVDFIKYLVREKNVDVNENHLFLAIKHNQPKVVDYLLTDHHLNPNCVDDHKRIPLSLSKSASVIQVLLQHGADADNAYNLQRKSLKRVFSKNPIKSPVKMFVIGNCREGKSTLIEAIEHEPTVLTSLVDKFSSPKQVDGVSQRTAGIIPQVFNSRMYGKVQFYDFAGQEAYYSSHAAVIKSAVDVCPPIFILVIGLHNDSNTIKQSVSYWLGIITNQCATMEGKAPLIVVGSHADLVKDISGKDRVILQTVEKYTSFDLITVIPMDCRYSNSNEMKVLRRYLGTTCNTLRSNMSVSLNSHMFLIYLIKNHSSELAVTLETVQNKVEIAVNEKPPTLRDTLPFIPKTIARLAEICIQLNDKGHILFLHNKNSPEKSFVIIDNIALLAEINGTVFAPEDFKQHCQLATSTGVVPQSKLADKFQKFDTNMILKFLSHLELAIVIDDSKVLSLLESISNKEMHLFCPALIRLEMPENIFAHQPGLVYHFGLVISSVNTDDFFNARFLHVLILRLALSLGLAPEIDPDTPSLQHHCSVWKTGVCWSTTDGFKVFVEVVTKKKVIVLVHAHQISFALLKDQTTVIRKVLDTANDYCSTVVTHQQLLSPTEVVYPPNEALTISIKSVAESVVNLKPYVVSTDGTHNLLVSDLLPLEVYSNLGVNILQLLFNDNQPAYNDIVSDQFLCAFSSCHDKNPQLISIICSALNCQPDCSLFSGLKHWRDKQGNSIGGDINDDIVKHGTYRSLRQVLDTISVFAGRNPLDLASIQQNEILLPEYDSAIHQCSIGAREVVTAVCDKAEKTLSQELASMLNEIWDRNFDLPIQKPVFSELSSDSVTGSNDPEQGSLVKSSVLIACPQGLIGTQSEQRLQCMDSNKADPIVEEMKREYGVSGEQINTKIREEDLHDLAGCFDYVETYLYSLGLNTAQQCDIKDLAALRGVQVAMKQALALWRQPKPWLATYRVLLKILLDLKRGDVVERVCGYIIENIPKQKL